MQDQDHYTRVCRMLEECGGVNFVDPMRSSARCYSFRRYRAEPECGSNEKPAPFHVYVYPPMQGRYRTTGSVEVCTFGAPTRTVEGNCSPWIEAKLYAIDLEAFDFAALERAAACIAALWQTFREVYP